MKIIFAGTPEFAAVALKALLQTDHEIVAVYTQPDRPAGRGRKLTPSAVKQAALDAGIEVYQPLSLKETQEQQKLADLGADIMVVAAYGLLLPQPVLDAPKLGCVNIHASLLPRWRGAAPIHRAILAGDSETGITIMQMDIGLDTGDMMLRTSCVISGKDTSASLHDRLASMGGKAIVKALDDVQCNRIQAEKQDDSLAIYAQKLKKSESKIDWSQSARQLDCQIRAFNPWPVAQCDFNGKVLRFWMSEVVSADHHAEPGVIVAATKQGIDIATGKDLLRVTSVQLPGGKAMDAASFINAHDVVGVQLQ